MMINILVFLFTLLTLFVVVRTIYNNIRYQWVRNDIMFWAFFLSFYSNMLIYLTSNKFDFASILLLLISVYFYINGNGYFFSLSVMGKDLREEIAGMLSEIDKKIKNKKLPENQLILEVMKKNIKYAEQNKKTNIEFNRIIEEFIKIK